MYGLPSIIFNTSVTAQEEWTVRESNPGGSVTFRTHPDRSRTPRTHMYNWYRVIPGSKELWTWR